MAPEATAYRVGDRVKIADRIECTGTVRNVFAGAVLIALDGTRTIYCARPETVRPVEQ